MKIKHLASVIAATTLLASFSVVNAQTYEYKPNIFTGGTTIYSENMPIADITSNIFTGGSTLRFR